MSHPLKAVVLAAGESSRFWPLAFNKHKSMYEIMGKPALQYTLEALRACGIADIAIIKAPGDTAIEQFFQDGSRLNLRLRYFVQHAPKGMGNAVLQAAEWLQGAAFVVVNADQVNADELLQPVLTKAASLDQAMILSAQETATPWNYGVLQTEGDRVRRIVEKPAQGTEPSNLMVIGLYLMPAAFLPILAAQADTHYNYEDAIQRFIDRHDAAYVVTHPTDTPEITLKFPWHLFRMNRYLMKRFLTASSIHPQAKISPHAVIEGHVVIQAGVRIFEHAVVKGPAFISENAILGNNSLVRDHSYVGRNTIVGFGTEIKNSILYDHIETHANYIGDSIVDNGCGFGAGTITANRRLDRGDIPSRIKGERVNTLLSFFGTVIGQNTKTGIQAGIMPGIKIGSNCQIGANTMVTQDLPDKTLCFERLEPVIRQLE